MSDGAKILTFIIFVVSGVLIPEKNFYLYILHFSIVVFSLFYFKMRFIDLLKRLLVGLPFVLVVSATAFLSYGDTQDSLWVCLSIVIKYSLVFFWGIVVFSNVHLYKGLKQLHFPKIFISIITLMERFTLVFKEEILRIIRAVKARSCGIKKIFKLNLARNISSVMLVRGFERSQRVFNAMNVRGFEGEVKFILDDKLRIYDILLVFIFFVIILGMNLIF